MCPLTIEEARSKGCGGSHAWQIELGLNKLCLRLLTMGSRVSPAKQKLGTHYSQAGPHMIAPVWAEKSTASTSLWSCSASHSILPLHLPLESGFKTIPFLNFTSYSPIILSSRSIFQLHQGLFFFDDAKICHFH